MAKIGFTAKRCAIILALFWLTVWIPIGWSGCKKDQPKKKKKSHRSPAAERCAQAEKLISKAIAAAGGRAALKAKTPSYTLKSKGTLYGRPYTLTTYWRAPDKLRMVFDNGAFELGYNGKQCWRRRGRAVLDCRSADRKSGRQTRVLLQVVALYPLLGESFVLRRKPDAKLADKPVAVLQARHTTTKLSYRLYFDRRRHHLLRVAYTDTQHGETVRMITDLEAHRKRAGVLVAHRSTKRINGKKVLLETVVSIDWTAVSPQKLKRPSPQALEKPYLRRIAKTTAAVTHHAGPYAGLRKKTVRLLDWIEKHHFVALDVPVYVYLKAKPETMEPDEFLSQIQIPVGTHPKSKKPRAGKKKKKDSRFSIKKLAPRKAAAMLVRGSPQKVHARLPVLLKWIEKRGYRACGPAQRMTFADSVAIRKDAVLSELRVPVEKQSTDKK